MEQEKFYYEVPSLARKEDAIEYIKETKEYHSAINAVGGLDKFLDNYEGWLEKLEQAAHVTLNGKEVPRKNYFFVRNSDRKIIGMVSIRLQLNEEYKNGSGHIGYSIRPTERGKGYNKINLYLALKVCQEHGIEEALLKANLSNPASWRTMEALGGIRYKEDYDEAKGEIAVFYKIDVNETIEKQKDTYEPLLMSQSNKNTIEIENRGE